MLDSGAVGEVGLPLQDDNDDIASTEPLLKVC